MSKNYLVSLFDAIFVHCLDYYTRLHQALTLMVRVGWWRGVAVTWFIRSTKLLFAGPG